MYIKNDGIDSVITFTFDDVSIRTKRNIADISSVALIIVKK
tara:strand:- start:381 stop:503 length:123 start_codon:yes stop_codon:yes gene_type:complete